LRIQICADNIRGGGAVTVASALLDEMIHLVVTDEFEWISHLSIRASKKVAHNMRYSTTSTPATKVQLKIADVRLLRQWASMPTRDFDARLTVFGPTYGPRRARREVAGFADGNLLPAIGTPVFHNQNFLHKANLKNKAKLLALRRYDSFIVQTPLMADTLALHVHRPIKIIPNVPASIFRSIQTTTQFKLPHRRSGEIRLFYPARGYPHKNHRLIEQICSEFETTFNSPLSVVTTLRKEEMKLLSLDKSKHIINVGEISTQTCAEIYSLTDGLLFPSLNETSSSSPLEAMAMGKPVFASNLPNIRIMTEGMAIYFDPYDPQSGALAIHQLVSNPEEISRKVQVAKSRIEEMGSLEDQARSYLHTLGEI